MLKFTLAATLVASMFAIPALAMETTCDNASMGMMKTQMEGMKDKAMQDKAMREMDMARVSMKANKIKDCKMHMANAMKAMM